MRKVILESPFAGDVEANVKYARAALHDSLLLGEAPIASHLLYTQEGVLDDTVPEERKLGIEAGLAWRTVADGSVVYVDRGISTGMRYGIAAMRSEGKPVEFRSIGRYTIKEVKPKIYLAQFADSAELANFFLRFQETYENPEWRNKKFTLQEFSDWYAKKYGSMSYAQDWAGFNIPLSVVQQVVEAGIDDPTPFDAEMELLYSVMNRSGYLIGVSSEADLAHEMAHALYTTNELYRSKMDNELLIMERRTLESVKDDVRKLMYHESVISDEVQAYLSTGGRGVIHTDVPQDTLDRFKAIYEEFAG